MSDLRLEFVGKEVKDMFGAYVGKVVGLVSNSDGSIESVGVDCGSVGLKELSYEQLLVQGDYIIYIPTWRMDVQKLLRQKSLALKRVKALQDLEAENELMRDDAEVLHLMYKKRLNDLETNEQDVIELLKSRLRELDSQSTRIKTIIFEAKLQYKSNDMTKDTYEQVNINSIKLLNRINSEKEEINGFILRIIQQTSEDNTITNESPSKNIEANQQDTTPNAKESGSDNYDDLDEKEKEPVLYSSTESSNDAQSNWLDEVLSKKMQQIQHNE